MIIKTVMLWIVAFGVVIGGIDYIIGCRFGAGKNFYEGFMLMGKTALGIIGIICLAPVFGEVLGGILAPLYGLIGADPAMFGSILAIDMGGYSLSVSMAEDATLGVYGGIVMASLLGPTLVYFLPLGFQLTEKEDHRLFAKGNVIGLIVMPFGCLAGGLAMGLSLGVIIINSIPVILMSALLVCGMLFFRKGIITACLWYARLISAIGVIGIMLAFIRFLTGLTILESMADVSEGFLIVGYISVSVIGFLSLTGLLLHFAGKSLDKVGRAVGLDGIGISALVLTTASATPIFAMIKDMKPRSKVVVTAFIVYGSFAGHVGFTAGVAPDMIPALVTGKFAAAVAALALALLLTRNERDKEKSYENE
jgi:ethanolamine transporter